LLLTLHDIGLNDRFSIFVTDMVHAPSTKGLNVRLVHYVVFIKIPCCFTVKFLISICNLESNLILSCIPSHAGTKCTCSIKLFSLEGKWREKKGILNGNIFPSRLLTPAVELIFKAFGEMYTTI
jgi:hypothetical protein